MVGTFGTIAILPHHRSSAQQGEPDTHLDRGNDGPAGRRASGRPRWREFRGWPVLQSARRGELAGRPMIFADCGITSQDQVRVARGRRAGSRAAHTRGGKEIDGP